MQVVKNAGLNEWTRTVIKKMPHLTKSQAVVLAMWSFGIVMTQSTGLTTVSVFLAALLGKKENTVPQQLRESYRDGKDKKGDGRASLDVSACFSPLLLWILSLWPIDQKRLVLAADASTLSTKFTVLAISVVYRGVGIPVAWKIVAATQPGSWKPHWLELFDHIKNGVESDWFVIVATDRGLYADWLYNQIKSVGWHPFMRINQQGQFRHHGQKEWCLLKSLVPKVGQGWKGLVTCFKTNSIECTLLGRWESDYIDPWLIVTDLPPEQADACWYSMRSWIECMFKDGKRGGLAWHQTKMIHPIRAERHWLAIAVAIFWQVSVGGAVDANLPISSVDELPPNHIARRNFKHRKKNRLLSCFRRGYLVIKAAFLNHLRLPQGSFFPEPWATFTPKPNVSQITLSSA